MVVLWADKRFTIAMAQDAEFEESKHPRGQKGNAGQFTTNKKKNVEHAEAYLKSKGYKTEPYHNPKANGVAYYGHGSISVNAAHRFWKDPISYMSSQEKSGYLSSGDPYHGLNHEIGHALYDPPDNFMTLSHQDLAGKVSKYARMNPKEFVSEVHAGMEAGKKYPEEIMNMFNRYAKKRE